MAAELIVGNGPLQGAAILLGKDPLCLDGQTVLPEGDGYVVVGAGGVPRRLREGDHISVGDVHLHFRSVPASDASVSSVLLRSCSTIFLFRALAEASEEAQRAAIETQIVRLLSDLFPITDGAVVLGANESAIRDEAAGRSLLSALVGRVGSEGLVVDAAQQTIVAPLYVHGRLRGILGLRFQGQSGPALAIHRETVAAAATLASAALESIHEVERLRVENAILQERSGVEVLIAGSSPGMRRLLEMVARVAPLDTSVLLLGESGTGKEVIARRIHRHSRRAEQPFVAINCAAITDTLLESELFGHEKGAFTGAVAQKKGKLEVAEGGTVFLDEIGELALPLQAKMLRVLQQREFERVGGTHTLRLDVRIIAATNRDLSGEARKGAFREDLYHRLNVVALRTPPLRERREDIPELARHFLALSSARCHRRVSAVSPEAERYLLQYDWPGNVRELENAIERAVVLGNSDTIEPEDLPETVLGFTAPATEADPLNAAKRDAILRAWADAGGDYKAAAGTLGVHPNSLLRMIRILGIRSQLKP